MKKHIYNKQGTVLLETVEVIPVCEQDFCDTCGDCLACYWEDKCNDGKNHFWVEYKEVNR